MESIVELLACERYCEAIVVILSAVATTFVWFGSESDKLLMCFLAGSCSTKTLPSLSNLAGCDILIGQSLCVKLGKGTLVPGRPLKAAKLV